VRFCRLKWTWLDACLILWFSPGTARAAVTVTQDTVTLKTWSEGLPDPNPWFELFAGYNYRMYPYTLRNNFGTDTEVELLHAAHTYLLVKQKVIELAPQDPRGTGDTENNRNKLLNFSNYLMEECGFERNLERSLEGLWNRIKLYPLYTNVKASIAGARAIAIEEKNLVNDFECFRGAVDDPCHGWYVKKGRDHNNRLQYTAEGREAIAFTQCKERYAPPVMPYRTKPEIAYRWANLAALFHEARDAATPMRDSFSRGWAAVTFRTCAIQRRMNFGISTKHFAVLMRSVL